MYLIANLLWYICEIIFYCIGSWFDDAKIKHLIIICNYSNALYFHLFLIL